MWCPRASESYWKALKWTSSLYENLKFVSNAFWSLLRPCKVWRGQAQKDGQGSGWQCHLPHMPPCSINFTAQQKPSTHCPKTVWEINATQRIITLGLFEKNHILITYLKICYIFKYLKVGAYLAFMGKVSKKTGATLKTILFLEDAQ